MPKFVEFVRRSGRKRLLINPDAVAAIGEHTAGEEDGDSAATTIWLIGVPEAKAVLGTVSEVRAKLSSGKAALSGKSDF